VIWDFYFLSIILIFDILVKSYYQKTMHMIVSRTRIRGNMFRHAIIMANCERAKTELVQRHGSSLNLRWSHVVSAFWNTAKHANNIWMLILLNLET
jgi:hypothetical protein